MDMETMDKLSNLSIRISVLHAQLDVFSTEFCEGLNAENVQAVKARPEVYQYLMYAILEGSRDIKDAIKDITETTA